MILYQLQILENATLIYVIRYSVIEECLLAGIRIK
nr:MAG TPA: hypothetical protein [Bacteriophage sp.]